MKIFRHANANYFFLQHAFVVAAAVFSAVLIGHYSPFGTECWIALGAFFASQTTIGTPIRQGLIIILLMIAGLILAFLIRLYVPQMITYVFLGLLGITIIYSSFIITLQKKTIFFLYLFLIVVFVATLKSQVPFLHLYYQIFAVIIGGFIGIIYVQIVFPVKIAQEFSKGVVSLLKILSEYSEIIAEQFLTRSTNQIISTKSIKKILQAQESLYPEWVYETGFNPGLRSGFRFFLLKLEQITEIFFSMEYLSQRPVDPFLLNECKKFITDVMQKNQELFQILIAYLTQNTQMSVPTNLTSDIVMLENILDHLIPQHLELIDVSESNLIITAFVRDIKDMRAILIELIKSMPT